MPTTPPFSPYLIAGLALPPGAARVIEGAIGVVARAMWSARPVIGERLRDFLPVTYRIDPTDLPMSFLLHVDVAGPKVRVAARDEAAEATATVRGGTADLLALLGGGVDGDALFFSRALVVEGATDAVVALRNALDDAGADPVGDVTARLGPAAAPARALLARLFVLPRRISDDLATVADALRGPLARRADAQGHRLDDIDARLERLERAQRRRSTP